METHEDWPSFVAALAVLVKNAYCEGFIEGSKEHYPRGGIPWTDNPRSRKRLEAILEHIKDRTGKGIT